MLYDASTAALPPAVPKVPNQTCVGDTVKACAVNVFEATVEGTAQVPVTVKLQTMASLPCNVPAAAV